MCCTSYINAFYSITSTLEDRHNNKLIHDSTRSFVNRIKCRRSWIYDSEAGFGTLIARGWNRWPRDLSTFFSNAIELFDPNPPRMVGASLIVAPVKYQYLCIERQRKKATQTHMCIRKFTVQGTSNKKKVFSNMCGW